MVELQDAVAVGAEVDDGLVGGGPELGRARLLHGRRHVDVIGPDVQLRRLEIDDGGVLRGHALGHAEKYARGVLRESRRGILGDAESTLKRIVLRDKLFDALNRLRLAALSLYQLFVEDDGAVLVAGGVGVGGSEENELVAGVIEVGQGVELLAFGKLFGVHSRKPVEHGFVLRQGVFLVLLEHDGEAVAIAVEGVFVDIAERISASGGEVEHHGDLLGLGRGLDGVGDLLLPFGLVCHDVAPLEGTLECADVGYLAK